MLRGDLATTPLDEVLRLLADDRATGRLALTESGDGAQARTAAIYLAAGEVYAAWLAQPDADPVLEADARLRLRLRADAMLGQEAWDDAIAAQEELFDWSIGELLVELGHLERVTLERVATEELLDAVSQAHGWRFGSYRFRRRERTRNRAGRTYGVPDLLEAVATRRAEQERLAVSSDAVPGMGDCAAELAGLEATVLGLVDGVRSVEEISTACGCTGLEMAQLLRSLTDRGCVLLPEPAAPAVLPEPPGIDDEDPLSRWSALLDTALPPPVQAEEPLSTVELVRSDLPPRPVENLDPETAERRARLRARAAEELLAAQAEAEALREAEVARAALADELSVAEEIRVFEDAVGIRSIEQGQSAGASELIAPVEAVVVAEASVEDAEPEAVEPVPSVEAIELVDAVASGSVAGVESVEPLDAVVSEETPSDDSPEPGVDPVAEELLMAELPLAQAAAETANPEELEQAVVAEQVAETEPVVEAEPVVVAELGAPELDAPEREAPELEDPVFEAPEEHDPALAAALLRELSSLGLDEEPVPAATRTPRVPAPRHAAPPSRKKRGIFGR